MKQVIKNYKMEVTAAVSSCTFNKRLRFKNGPEE